VNQIAAPIVQGNMKRAIAVGTLVLSACVGAATSPTDSGIAGKATIGPTCPLEQPGQPPCVASYNGPVVVMHGARTITTFRTNTDGTFKMNLKPGRYTLTSAGVRPTLQPVEVIVRPHAYTTIDLEFDSGIR
jgi:hypothetical protein